MGIAIQVFWNKVIIIIIMNNTNIAQLSLENIFYNDELNIQPNNKLQSVHNIVIYKTSNRCNFFWDHFFHDSLIPRDFHTEICHFEN